MMNMKKALALLLAIVMVLGMFPMGVFAQETSEKTHLETCLEGCTGEDCTAEGCTCRCHYRHLDTCLEGCTGMLSEEEVCECDCHFQHLETCLEDCAEEDCECACHLHSELCVENCQGETKTGEECDCSCHEAAALNLDKPVQKEPSEETAQKDPEEKSEEETEEETEEEKKVCEVCQKYDCGLTHVFCETCQKYDCGLTHVFCEVCQKYDCGLTHVFCQLCQKYDCGLTHVFCETCQKYDCGIDHAAEKAQQTDPVTCICGLAENHEGDCLECECGLVKNHEGDCLENPAAIVETTVTEYADKDTKVEITGMMPGNVQLFLENVDVPAALTEGSSIEKDHVAFSLDISLGAVQQSSSVLGLLRGAFGAAPEVEEWQPEEGQPVTVTMDVKGCEDGNIIAVYHEDGETGEVELVGLYPVEDGKITFEAKSFSAYTGIVVHYEFLHSPTNQVWYSVPINKEVDLRTILSKLDIPLNAEPTTANGYQYSFKSYPNDTADKIKSILGFEERGDKVYLNPFKGGLNWHYYIEITVQNPSGVSITFTVRSNEPRAEKDVLKPANNQLCFLYEGDKFYWYDEDTSTKIEEMPFLTLEEAAESGWTKFNYNNVKILMNNTYHGGIPTERIGGTYEEIKPVVAGQTLLIQRYDGFKDPLIQVDYSHQSTFDIWGGVTVDNKSAAGENLTAVVVTDVNYRTNTHSYGGLMILRGKITDSKVDLNDPSTYRGTGVHVTSVESDGTSPEEKVMRGDGGILELENNCEISGFATGILQDYGTTSITYRNQFSGDGQERYVGMSLDKNGHSIVLYHNTWLEKWSTFANVSLPVMDIFLHDVGLWKSGDIVLGSGYEWRVGYHYTEDGLSGYDHWWTPVIAADEHSLRFDNGSSLSNTMGLAYYDVPGRNIADYGGNYWKVPGQDKFIDPYPVIRFEMYTVYNVALKTWYHTLGEAVADTRLADGHELVFYGSTNESGTITISKNITIRSSYEGEASYSEASVATPTVDARAGDNCTATWERTDAGIGIKVRDNAKVNFEGTIIVDGAEVTCGTLTLDANGKGGVMDMNDGTEVNIENGITLTGGVAVNGGAVMNMGGTLNITGGTFSNNAASQYGDGIYQDGIMNLSGNPSFTHTGEDVYLPATATADNATGFRVITKAGELTYTDPVTVTLGNSVNNLYDGRNVVEGSTNAAIDSGDINKFRVTNDKVEHNPNPVNSEKYGFVHNASDKTPSKSGNVLELDVRGDLKIEKKVTFEDTTDSVPADTKFTFRVTLPDNNTYSYTIYSGAKEAGNGTIASGGTIELEKDQYAIIKNVELGSFTVTETGLNDDYGTPSWGTTSGETVRGTIEEATVTTVTCTNTKLAKTAVLNLTKRVEKDYVNDADPTDKYTFTIDFAGTGKTATYKIGTGTEQTLTDGGTITLSKDQTAIITMPVGAYTIIEKNPGDKFRDPTWSAGVTVDTANKYKVSGTLTANETESVTCTNHYTKQVGDLIIEKTVDDVIPDYPAFVFTVSDSKGVSMDVTIDFAAAGTNSVTIKDLPLGTYTVKENTGWAAKYTVKGSETETAAVTAANAGKVSFTNDRNTKWLTWDTNAKNLFDGDLTK